MYIENTPVGTVEMWFENPNECKVDLHLSTHRAHKKVVVRFENSNGAASFRRDATEFSIVGGDKLTALQRKLVNENIWSLSWGWCE